MQTNLLTTDYLKKINTKIHKISYFDLGLFLFILNSFLTSFSSTTQFLDRELGWITRNEIFYKFGSNS